MISHWVPHQLRDEQNRDFAAKIWRNFGRISINYAILLQMMERGFTIGNPGLKLANVS